MGMCSANGNEWVEVDRRDVNELDFDGRVAIVTGAGGGMGREHALMLSSRGACVVVNDVRADAAIRTAEDIQAAGGVAVPDSHDVVTEASALVQTALSQYDRLDIVVNNAGILRHGTFAEMSSDDWWQIFDVSFKGVIEVSRYALPHLLESRSGRLINLASNAMMGLANVTAYASAKAAVWAFGNSLALETRDSNLQVSTLLPVAWTPMTERAFTNPTLQKVMKTDFPASAVSAFVTWLSHQDTRLQGSFEVGGVSAGQLVPSTYPRFKVSEATPEAWAKDSQVAFQDGDLVPLRSARESLLSQLLFVAPEVKSELPRAFFT